VDFSVRFALSEADLVAFNEYVNKTVPAFRNSMRKAQAIVAVAVLCGGLWVTRDSALGRPLRLGLVAIGVAAAWFAFPWLIRRTALRRSVRKMQEARAPLLGRATTVWLDDDGIHRADEVSASVTAWAAVDRVEETPGQVFVFIGPAEAFVIPRSAGPQVDAFAAEVRRRLVRR
jgi:hypothetical protein